MTAIRLLILDVDGVLTAGDLPYEAVGTVEKVFYVQDGGAIRHWQRMGGLTAIISGRSSPVVLTRADDLGISHVYQGVTDKVPVFESLLKELEVSAAETAYMGDDLLDVPPMQRCGYAIAPANAVPAAKRTARLVTRRSGGAGAVHEAIDRLLRHNQQFPDATRRVASHANGAKDK